jgi:hypothetical protein
MFFLYFAQIMPRFLVAKTLAYERLFWQFTPDIRKTQPSTFEVSTTKRAVENIS